jgi:thioester reductase-like protein
LSVILLARPRNHLTARARVDRLLDWFGLGAEDRERLTVVEGHLDDPDFGLERPRYEALASRVDEIVHCASSTSFSERKRAEIEKANVCDLDAILDLAARGGCAFFHHVSTAYVAGRRSGACAEELVETREFTNPYEETKYRGERIVKERCDRDGIGLNIYRPSIVYGDSGTGRTIRFDGVYYPVKAVSFFRSLYEKDIVERGARRSREMGVKIDARGRVHLPLRVPAAPLGGINLVPIDFFLKAFMAIMDEGPAGRVFHVVNANLTTIESLAAWTGEFFHVDGIRTAPPEEFAETPKNALELLFDRSIEAYDPYMKDTRVFESARTGAILAKRGVACPTFDWKIFSTCMRYAVEVDWGARLFDGAT